MEKLKEKNEVGKKENITRTNKKGTPHLFIYQNYPYNAY